jgi:hypothetical protein
VAYRLARLQAPTLPVDRSQFLRPVSSSRGLWLVTTAAPMPVARGTGGVARAAPRHAGEQYAWPRSHEAQIAKSRLQRRQVFWRSGASTTSKQRRASTGHGS